MQGDLNKNTRHVRGLDRSRHTESEETPYCAITLYILPRNLLHTTEATGHRGYGTIHTLCYHFSLFTPARGAAPSALEDEIDPVVAASESAPAANSSAASCYSWPHR